METMILSEEQLTSVLEKQTIDFSVPDPSQTKQLSMPLYQGAGYRQDFKTWSLLVNGGFMQFNLNIQEAIPVELTMSICAALVSGQANCPISIKVNGNALVTSYSDHNPNFHDYTNIIPASMLHSGDNQIVVSLDYAASTQLFIKAVTVDQAVLSEQTIDFSVPNPQQTKQLSLPLYQGAGYRSDFKTWSLLRNGGFFKLNLSIAEAIDVQFTLGLCAALVNGKANCPISIYINNSTWIDHYRDTNANFHSQSWNIPEKLLKSGNNEIKIVLDNDASTQLFINAVTVSGE